MAGASSYRFSGELEPLGLMRALARGWRPNDMKGLIWVPHERQ